MDEGGAGSAAVAGAAPAPEPSWERRHPGRPEWWWFDFCAPDGSLGGHVALGFDVAPGVAWCWAALVGDRRPYLLVRDLEVAVPRGPGSRQIRAEALWADANCETPFEHWSVGLEAFGVAMDDPDEALRGEVGDRTGLALDLEWEAAGPVVGGAGSYQQACAVHGEVLVGGGAGVETLAVDGHGWRHHSWGAGDPLAASSWWGGRLDDGVPWATRAVAREAVHDRHRAPLRLEAGGRQAVLERSLCWHRLADGRQGLGWGEWRVPEAGPGPVP